MSDDMENSETCYARLASVTSAFLVLKNDKTITGGARKLIEKECELLADGRAGGHLIRELIALRRGNAQLLVALRDLLGRAHYALAHRYDSHSPEGTRLLAMNDLRMECKKAEAVLERQPNLQ